MENCSLYNWPAKCIDTLCRFYVFCFVLFCIINTMTVIIMANCCDATSITPGTQRPNVKRYLNCIKAIPADTNSD